MAEPPRRTRRDMLRLGLALPVVAIQGLAGCTLSDPTIDATGPPPNPGQPSPAAPSPSHSPSPTSPASTPTPTVTGADQGAAREQGLATLAAAILAGPRRRSLSKGQRALLRSITEVHRAHAAGLAPDAAPGQAPEIADLSLRESLTRLARREAAAASAYRRSALSASGLDALLWGSLSVAASAFAGALTDSESPPVAPVTERRPAALLSDVEAVQALVSQLHAIVYGYQLAIGQLPVLSRERGRAIRELLGTRVQRERLIAFLSRRSADVPAAEAAYVPSTRPRDAASSAKLIREMQIAVLPFYGEWLAAAGDARRAQALTMLASTADRARSWGAPLQAWPGYASR